MSEPKIASGVAPAEQFDKAVPKGTSNRQGFAIVRGASTGIGYELAKCCAQDGLDLLIVADEPEIETAAADFRAAGVNVIAVQADLATMAGVDRLVSSVKGIDVGVLIANAGRGLGGSFSSRTLRRSNA